jgi:C4-dicarboxylate-specific signal transduction histidine kinase
MKSRSQSHLIAILIFLLSGISSTLYWWQFENSAVQLREETLRQSAIRAKQVNGAVAEQISMLFFNIDAVLRGFVEHYATNDEAAFHSEVRRVESQLPSEAIFQVAVIDANGYVVASKLETTDKVFLGDRDYFKAHLETGESRLFISPPLFGRITKKWTIIFSWPIRRNGQFAGVAYIGVSPSYLQKSLLSLVIPPFLAAVRSRVG